MGRLPPRLEVQMDVAMLHVFPPAPIAFPSCRGCSGCRIGAWFVRLGQILLTSCLCLSFRVLYILLAGT